jgi:hypothetical protein
MDLANFQAKLRSKDRTRNPSGQARIPSVVL